uniref:inhibitor of nuclear factor kappa-B kinase-interacting protein-like n=1 Tax=Myxine glutinosa TaxID=7769 RepID=UPI00358F8DF6
MDRGTLRSEQGEHFVRVVGGLIITLGAFWFVSLYLLTCSTAPSIAPRLHVIREQVEQLEERLKPIQVQRTRTVKRKERTAEERRNFMKQLKRATAKTQHARKFWNRRMDELTAGIGKLQNMTRNHHATTAEDISLVEGRLFSQKQQLEDLEDSTRRNIKTIKWQAEEDVSSVHTWVSQTVSYIDGLEKRSRTLIRDSKMVSNDPTRPSMFNQYLPRVREVLYALFTLSRDIAQSKNALHQVQTHIVHLEHYLVM